jgi:hypothetical protein
MSKNFYKVIKQQIIKAIKDPIFLKPIENHISRLSRVLARKIFQYLFNVYSKITPIQLDDNDTMMKEQWDPSKPTIYLFSKIQHWADTSDTGNAPYTIRQVLVISFSHVFHTGTMQ